jgi:DNA polymerase-1
MILIIDLSYAIFHRFYAIKSYLKISQREDITMTLDDQNFKDLYKRTFIDTIHKLCKTYKPKTIVFAEDCPRSEIWRNDLMTDYKNRPRMTDFDARTFGFVINDIIPYLKMEEFKMNRKPFPIDVFTMKHENAEADDLVYIYSRHIQFDAKKTIITGDNDYLQLLDDNTEIYNLKSKSLREKSLGTNEKDILVKVLMGDPSDNLKPVCTKKKALNLINDKSYKDISEMYQENDRFCNNMKMVNMNLIPDTMIEAVKAKKYPPLTPALV